MMKLVKRVATVAFLGLTLGAPAIAQWWRPSDALPPGLPNPNMPWDGRKRSRSGGGGSSSYFGDPATPVKTVFYLTNKSPWRVAYWINGHSKPVMNPGESKSWHFTGDTEHYPKMSIKIDTGRPGQTVEYDLDNGQSYYFILQNGMIDLSN